MNSQDKLQEQLVKELGLDNLPEDRQQELLIKTTEVLLKRIFLETMEKLSDHGRSEYEKMIKKGAEPQQLEEFLKSNIQNYENMVQGVIDDFKEEMKEDISR
ncbi:hypothetical protein BMS3Abin15_00625 [bacterium BMS3Abin15]|nr:hypothetical protein BMS3Abin15_00625 [bacterium BMS3Abin15]HDZ85867.1 hypothetical protein [Candidatus Moranbacteria bacterium]